MNRNRIFLTSVLTFLLMGFSGNLRAEGVTGNVKSAGDSTTHTPVSFGGRGSHMLSGAGYRFSPLLNAGINSINPVELNPFISKKAAWDTHSLNMYQVDMTAFKDTLTYIIHDPDQGKHFTYPCGGIITSGFGYRNLFGSRFHYGMDMDLETGDPVYAAMSGTVRIARYSNGYGNCVVVCHEDGMETLYGHLSEIQVVEGQKIGSGEQIGLGGSTGRSTGSHLHFEIRIFGEQVNPKNVIPYKDENGTEKCVVKIERSWFDHLNGGKKSEDVPDEEAHVHEAEH